jgi:hypothetical protein
MWELSTPFIYNKIYMDIYQFNKISSIYIANAIAFIIVFFSCRFIWTGIMYHYLFTHLDLFVINNSVLPAIIVYAGIGSIMCILNTIWLYKIVKKTYKLLTLRYAYI